MVGNSKLLLPCRQLSIFNLSPFNKTFLHHLNFASFITKNPSLCALQGLKFSNTVLDLQCRAVLVVKMDNYNYNNVYMHMYVYILKKRDDDKGRRYKGRIIFLVKYSIKTAS